MTTNINTQIIRFLIHENMQRRYQTVIDGEDSNAKMKDQNKDTICPMYSKSNINLIQANA
jgi:hypothetical protein